MDANFKFPPPPPPPPRAAPTSDTFLATPDSRRGFRGGRGGPQGRGRGAPARSGYNDGRTYDNRAAGGSGHSSFLGQMTGSSLYHTQVLHNSPSISQHSHPNQDHRHQTGAYTQKSNRLQTPHSFSPRPAPAPAVPSFGAPLPTFPVRPTELKDSVSYSPNTSNNLKRKRGSNQLGLTPDGADNDYNSEAEADEEQQFMANSGPLQFEYNGQTSVLRSAAEVAAWIAERKKRWPTRARVEEKQKAEQKIREERNEARRKLQDEQAEARKRLQAERDHARNKALGSQRQAQELRKEEAIGAEDDKMRRALEKHLLKAEKLRRKLERSQAKPNLAKETSSDAAKATAILLKEVALVDITPQDDLQVNEDIATRLTESAITSIQPTLPAAIDHPEATDMLDTSSSLDSSDSSDLSDSDSDSVSTSSSPEEHSNKAQNPPRVAAPARQGVHKPRICRYFLAKGRCTAGDACRFSHELPERGSARSNAQRVQPVEKRRERKSLYARLVEQELEAEDRRVLDTIRYLGQAGLLEVKMESGNG